MARLTRGKLRWPRPAERRYVVLEVQKLVGSALTDNYRCHSVYTLVDNDAQVEFYPITDVQLVKDLISLPRVREITVKLPSIGDESSGIIHYALQFLLLCTSAHHSVGSWSSQLVMKAWTKTATVSSSSDRHIRLS